MSKKRQRDSNQLKNATLADFDLDLGADVPSASISLARRSLDQRRVHRRSIPTAPVSPIKGNVDSLQNSAGSEADWIDEPDGYISDGMAKEGGSKRDGKRYVASVSSSLYLAG